MANSARYSICIGLSNMPKGEDWDMLKRLAKVYFKGVKDKKLKIRIYKMLDKREIFLIPDLLKTFALDRAEYLHLMNCLYRNDLESDCSGEEGSHQIYEENEHWQLEEVDTAASSQLCRWASTETL